MEKIIKIPNSYRDLIFDDSSMLFVIGGAGSGKTYNITYKILLKGINYKRKVLIVRKTYNSIKDTNLKIFLDILKQIDIPYIENKSTLNIYLSNGTEFIFRGLVYSNSSEKEKNRLKSITDITDIWIDEATELTFEEFQQLLLRLRGEPVNPKRQIITSFNPISSQHWLKTLYYDKGIGKWYRFTYKDNPFLDENFINHLENLKYVNENLYRVYTLGDWGITEGLVFSNWVVSEKEPKGIRVYGIDFGFTNPTAILEIYVDDMDMYIVDEFYKSNITTQDIVEVLKDFVKDKNDIIYCDNAEPDRIEEIKKAGFKAVGVKFNIKQSIEIIQRMKIYVNPKCVNFIKEINSYSWKKVNEGYTDIPIEVNNHTIDAMRYAVIGYLEDKIDTSNFIKLNLWV